MNDISLENNQLVFNKNKVVKAWVWGGTHPSSLWPEIVNLSLTLLNGKKVNFEEEADYSMEQNTLPKLIGKANKYLQNINF